MGTVRIVRRVAIAFVAVVAAGCLGACGGGGRSADGADHAQPDGTGDTAPTETSAAQPIESGLDPSSLPGPVAMEAIGCGTTLDGAALGEAFSGLDDPQAALGALQDMGFDSTTRICVMDPDGGNLRAVSEPGHEARYPGVTWDGTSLYWYDVTDEQWIVADRGGGNPRPWEDGEAYFWRVSPAGDWYTNTSWGESGFFVTRTGEEPSGPSRRHLVTGSDACCSTFRWSPDSRWILFYSTKSGADCSHLVKVDVESGERVALTGPGSPNADAPVCAEFDSAHWSPDGTSIVFNDDGSSDDATRPLLMSADGSGLRPLVPVDSFADPLWTAGPPAWSPDGAAVLFDVIESDGQGTYLASADGSRVVRIGAGDPMSVRVVMQYAWAPSAPAL